MSEGNAHSGCYLATGIQREVEGSAQAGRCCFYTIGEGRAHSGCCFHTKDLGMVEGSAHS